ncbi:MAG: PAS domain S-box protein [Burkholderiaceae bacterium]|nr:PAS domain S-box protein [Burkholderiaceae bacterium]
MDGSASLQSLEQFFDHLSDGVLLFDRRALVTFANTAALRRLPGVVDTSVAQWEGALGAPLVEWLRHAIAASPGAMRVPGQAAARSAAAARRTASQAPPPAVLLDGQTADAAWQSLGTGLYALRLHWRDSQDPRSASDVVAAADSVRDTNPIADRARRSAAALPPTIAGPVIAELMQVLWNSPFPAMLQDSRMRIVDVNPAFASFSGYAREQLIGSDPIGLEPEEDRASSLELRERWQDPARRDAEPALVSRRIVAADGRERWFRATGSSLTDENGRIFKMSVLQDSTAEHVARERADRSAREIDDWFDLSPIGMVLFDEAGLLVRTNPAFDALAGVVPTVLSDASPELRQLLGWTDHGPSPALEPSAKPVVAHGWLPLAQGGLRRLRSIVRCYTTPGGARRHMAILEDRSAEEERDLAQMQIGALMDTAGVGLATFQETSGWVRQRQAPSAAEPGVDEAAVPTSAALQSISRDIVADESMAEYDALQQALRTAQRAEVRYAIRHPKLGLRWLLTRVEPATLASGKRTTSVVTLDITEQHQTQQRSEQLLRELTTILESTSAGIAYIRGDVLVRCNRRFEAMLGLHSVGVAGSGIQELFGSSPQGQRIASETLQALTAGLIFETEFSMDPGATLTGEATHNGNAASNPTRWYALSVRRTGPVSDQIEAIAVLSDITRLKSQQVELEQLARDRELMFSLSEVGIAFLRDGVLQRVNDALAQLAGYPAAELQGLALSSLFADADEHERLTVQEQNALRQHGRWIGERQLHQRDGRVVWVQVSTRLVGDDPSGGVIASFVNVDARHRAEHAVALQANRTRAILDSVLVGIVTVGPRGIEWMNRSARRMFGADLGDFIDQPISTVATPEPDHPFRRTQYLEDLIEGEAETFECRVKARDGREFWVVGNAVVTGRESRGRQLTYALLDIEQRRQAEARIEEAQASLQRIIEAAPMAITVRDARTLRILQANVVAARSMDLTPAQIVGRSPEEMFTPEEAAQRRLDMESALRASAVTQREYRMTEQGEARVWDARYLPLAAPGQAPDQLLMVATDVTEQRAAEQAKFDAAIAQREMLVKEVHHRIKNNLQGVAGLLQQIGTRKPEMAAAMSEVVGQVQAIAQVYGLQVGAGGPLHVTGVVEAIAGSVQRTFGHPIRFSVQGEGAELWVLPEAESIPIALTLNELLTNAVKHSLMQHREAQTAGDTLVPAVDCTLICDDSSVRIVIRNRARLPDGFNLARVPGGVSGLGLVRALLPRRCAKLTIEPDPDQEHVVATVSIGAPGVVFTGRRTSDAPIH